MRGAVDRVTQRLADRVKTVEERYAETLPDLEQVVSQLGKNVRDHISSMGIKL